MELKYLPYLRAIELNIQDAFPGRKVAVWSEPGFNPRMIAVKARVDDAGAYMTVNVESDIVSEAYISDILIAELREVLE